MGERLRFSHEVPQGTSYPHKMQKTGQLSGFLHFVRVRSALRHFVGESKPFSHIFERQPLSLKNGKRVLRQ
jgi:hypothetical protein